MQPRLLIFKIWKEPKVVLAALAAMALVFLWPVLPVGGLIRWLNFFYLYRPQNILYGIMTVLTGFYVGLYVYQRYCRQTCDVRSANTGTAAALGGMLLGACPACIPLLAFVLPLSVTITLSYISWVFMLISILIFLVLIYKLHGFQRV